MTDDKKKKKNLINQLKSLFSKDTTAIQQTAQDPSMYALTNALVALSQNLEYLEDVKKTSLIKSLPADRQLKYYEFDKMEDDPLCGQALWIHVNNALVYDEEAGYSVQVESKADENDPVVSDLRSVFHEWMQEHSKKILHNVAKYGCFGVRPYFKPDGTGIDIKRTLVGPEGHPSTFKIYETLGSYVGVHSQFQHPNHAPRLSEPWQFIIFKSPNYSIRTGWAPKRVHPTNPGYQFDIWDDNPPPTLNESFDYGKSLFNNAFTPWMNLGEASLALLIARLKSAQRETLVGYPIGNQDPTEAAKEVRELTDMFQARDDQDSKRTLSENLVRVAKKFIIPYDSTGKGQLVFNQTEPNINIEGISDLMLYIKVLCGSLGVDPSLVGFSDMMAGGLGEGGWLRTSILATTWGIALRQALRNGYERMFEMHVKLKWGKIYLPEKKPWRVKFKAVSDAKEREANEVRMGNMDFAERLTNLLLAMEEQEGAPKIDKHTLKNIMLTNILKQEEPVVQELLKLKPKPSEQTQEKAGKFNEMKVEEKVSFIDQQLNGYLESLYVH